MTQRKFRDDIWPEYVDECEYEGLTPTRYDFELYLREAYVQVRPGDAETALYVEREEQ